MITLGTPQVLRVKIPNTSTSLHEITLLDRNSLLFKGKLVLMDDAGHRENYEWQATYRGNENWNITGQGALLTSGNRVPAADKFPFSTEPIVNQGVKNVLLGWLNQNKSSKPLIVETKLPPQNPPAAPKQPDPAPPPPPLVVVAEEAIPTPSTNGTHGEIILHIPLGEVVCFQKQISDPSFSGQPRKEFNENSLRKLARNIQKQGQKVPALVCRIDTIPGKKWELIAGERRWRALTLNGFPYLRAIEEKPGSKQQQHLLALIENLFREDPGPLELSNALQEQINAGETQVSLAEATSVSLGTLRRLLSIQTVHPELKPLLGQNIPKKNRIRLSEAAVLGSIHPDHQVRIWNEAKQQPTRGLIVAKLHELGRPFIQRKRETHKDRHNEIGEVAERVNRRLNALSLALIELQGVSPQEWLQFAVFRGNEKASDATSLLTGAIRHIDEVKGKISRARKAAQSS